MPYFILEGNIYIKMDSYDLSFAANFRFFIQIYLCSQVIILLDSS